MKKANDKIIHHGIGFFGLLQIAFIVLKLCNVISWSWWLVLLPILAEVGVVLLFVIFVLIIVGKSEWKYTSE